MKKAGRWYPAVMGLLIIMLLVGGCGSSKPQEAKSPVPAAPQKVVENPSAKADTVTPTGLKLIMTATIQLETEAFNTTETQLKALVERFQGRIENSQVTKHNYLEGGFSIRIPTGVVAEFVDAVAAIPDVRVQQRSISQKDVSEEYIDTTARLENLRLQEQRLREIMNRAGTVDEVLKVENELTKVRTLIDSITARIRYLDRRVDLTTVQVTLKETGREYWPDFGRKFMNNLRDSLILAGDVLLGTISFLIGFTPVFLLGYGAWCLWRRYKKKPSTGAGG